MLRPTFLSFETAKRALTSSQLGLDTVGHNISNVNTPGYTRQRVDQVSISSSGYKSKYQAFGVQFPGQGSDVTGISQVRDPFLDTRYRTQASGCGELGAKSDGLAEINAIFDEIMKTGAHAKMGDFLKALDGLTVTPESKELATVLRNNAEQLAMVLGENSVRLDSVEKQVKDELGNTVEDVNSILEQIGMLNAKIKEDNFYGNPSNELNDQRNMLIDQLSELVDIEVKRTPEKISSDVTVTNLSVEIKGTGIELVNSGNYHNLKLNHDEATGAYSIAVTDGISGFPLDGMADITNQLYTGAIKGHLDVLNGDGGSGGNGFRGIPYYRATLDGFAAEFAETMNSLNRIPVLQDDGTEFAPPKYLEMPLFATNDGTDTITAKNLCVSAQWLKNSQFINNTTRNGSFTVDAGGFLSTGTPAGAHYSNVNISQVASVDPDGFLLDINGDKLQDTSISPTEYMTLDNLARVVPGKTIAGGEADVPPGGIPGLAATDNLTTIKDALTSKSNVFSNNGFKGSFQEYLTSFQGDMSLDKKLNDSMLSASITVLSGIANSRDAVSAVSIDEEGINMMTFQNYYNAAARYMTTLDEALGTIIQGMGVVGR